jgi:formate/nitrite transporter FocA (FNT family)
MTQFNPSGLDVCNPAEIAANLLAVSAGNIVGGAVGVALACRLAYGPQG